MTNGIVTLKDPELVSESGVSVDVERTPLRQQGLAAHYLACTSHSQDKGQDFIAEFSRTERLFSWDAFLLDNDIHETAHFGGFLS